MYSSAVMTPVVVRVQAKKDIKKYCTEGLEKKYVKREKECIENQSKDEKALDMI